MRGGCGGWSARGFRRTGIGWRRWWRLGSRFRFCAGSGGGGEVMAAAWMEFMAQTAAAGGTSAGRRTGRRVKRGYLAAVAEYRVHASVRVGESVRVCGALEKQFGRLAQGRFEVWRGERNTGMLIGHSNLGEGGERLHAPLSMAHGGDSREDNLVADARMTFFVEFE